MNRAAHSAPLGDNPEHSQSPEPAQRTDKHPADARDDEKQVGEKQAEKEAKQEQLGAGSDHQ